MKRLTGVVLLAAACHAAPPLNQTLASCPRTKAEQTVYTQFQQRTQRYQSGNLASAIKSNDYTTANIQADLNAWRSLYISAMKTAVSVFKDTMQAAKARGQGGAWNDAAKDLLAELINCGSFSGASIINTAIDGLRDTLKALEPTSTYPDFFQACAAWETDIQDKDTKLEAAFATYVQQVTDAKEKTGNKLDTFTAAYRHCTQLYEHLPSERQNFNVYYARYLLSAKVTIVPQFVIMWKPPNPEVRDKTSINRFVYPMVPPGLDACTVAKQVHSMNLGCFNDNTAGLGTLLGFRVVTQALPIPDSNIGMYLVNKCGHYSTSDIVGCESINPLAWSTDRNSNACKSTVATVVPSSGWPNQFMKDMCTTKVQPGQPYYGQSYWQGGSGQYQPEPKFPQCG